MKRYERERDLRSRIYNLSSWKKKKNWKKIQAWPGKPELVSDSCSTALVVHPTANIMITFIDYLSVRSSKYELFHIFQFTWNAVIIIYRLIIFSCIWPSFYAHSIKPPRKQLSLKLLAMEMKGTGRNILKWFLNRSVNWDKQNLVGFKIKFHKLLLQSFTRHRAQFAG